MNEHKPTLDDYRSMMGATHAPAPLREAVLSEARARRMKGRATQPSVRAVHQKRPLPKGLAVAACLAATALAVTGGLVGGLPGLSPSSERGGNVFFLAAYAAEGSGIQPGTAATLSADDFKGTGGNSGAFFDPDTGQFTAYDEWSGFKYGFDLECSGRNIASVAYEIEGDHAFFETIDLEKATRPRTQEEIDSGDTSAIRYAKTVTFDYDDQRGIQDDYIYSIYLGFPVPEAARQAMFDMRDGGDAHFLFYECAKALDTEAARTLAQCRLHLTATFEDGSTQAKTYAIAPVDDFEQRIDAYWSACCASSDRPEPPSLFAIVELDEA